MVGAAVGAAGAAGLAGAPVKSIPKPLEGFAGVAGPPDGVFAAGAAVLLAGTGARRSVAAPDFAGGVFVVVVVEVEVEVVLEVSSPRLPARVLLDFFVR